MLRWAVGIVAFATLCQGFWFGQTNNDPLEEEQDNHEIALPTVKLSNDYTFPLVGVGVGNLAHDRIETNLMHALRNDGYRLIDTNRASHNERMVANAIEKGMENLDPQDSSNIVNVVTKVS